MLSHKDYTGEIECLEKLILIYRCVTADKIFNVGCGANLHEILLVGHGFEFLDVDISNEMIEKAKYKLSGLIESLRYEAGLLMLNSSKANFVGRQYGKLVRPSGKF